MSRTANYHTRHGNQHVDERQYPTNQPTSNATFFIILVSLLFVAIFGGALVGGVVSGEPSSGFFLTVIAASGAATSLVLLASICYCCQQRRLRREAEKNAKEHRNANIQPTYTRTVDEDEEAAYYDSSAHYLVGREPVEEEVQTIHARSMAAGDVSAMSPGTYDYDVQSYDQTGSQYTCSEYHGYGYRSAQYDEESYNGPFDFTSVASSTRESGVRREDPPEEFGGSQLKSVPVVSRDPEAAVATADGKVIPADATDPPLHSPANASQASRYDVVTSEEDKSLEKERQQQQIKEWEKRTANAKKGRTSQVNVDEELPFEPPFDLPLTSVAPQTLSTPPPPPPPRRSTRTPPQQPGKGTPKSSTGTPVGSEAGSAASSVFLKPFANMFGKKRASSEAGYSDVGSVVRGSEVGLKRAENKLPPSATARRPPIPGKKTVDERTPQGLQTIAGKKKEDKYVPSSPGKNSVFSIPPPRRVPSTPGAASEVPSEFRSVADSSAYSHGVASSTFNPEAHERALRRIQNNATTLGAAFNDMPTYYEEDESGIASAAPSGARSVASVQKSLDGIGYDVFAPSGPLGMVVDTVAKGCIVHSLKKNSPMQDLINPGDLIVALDDFDVRKMDAASLTKLMAKKSQQKERKFTLVPMDHI